MFEISQLKEKKLPELQELAKELNVPKFKSLKKIDLVYQILDLQAANPTIVAPSAPPAAAVKTPRPRRERISKSKDAASQATKTPVAPKQITAEAPKQNQEKPATPKQNPSKSEPVTEAPKVDSENTKSKEGSTNPPASPKTDTPNKPRPQK